MAKHGRYIWDRPDLKPDKHEKEILKFVEDQYYKAHKNRPCVSVSWSPQIIILPLLGALSETFKVK